ncbi:MAG: hypothetical protein NZ483_11860, partial [Verrucomicrobiae bacterium]|nr:hypothetical protein [Verrucomicrobiae bacterium]MDW8345304.1 hypothetical protein [Verrucomicrobiae bacterium]
TNFWVNNGTIIGNGTLATSFRQSSTGSTVASNGVLALFGTYNSGQATFTSSGGGFGTFRAATSGTLRVIGNVASGMGGSWQVDNGGTLEVAGVNVDLGAAFMPMSQLNGTVRVNTGGNLTLSSATAGGPTLGQQGTFQFDASSGAANIFMPNSSGLANFTNAGTIFITGNSSGT